ncbi:hypothetical protein GO988_06305 [Hymenobacter sp. HMF4947]|uniref:HNH endonuclease n=1 Tax=Hymenobacter ginkgonis TaxID=2682976 RepID=A0A7K1TC35_9BACT|nr:HNH endonuclease signature motif containing protein [Hymenobacter ginkgonis]MVN75933.1 hypothetical protein [Hymenobacter ginkgonis]
MARLSKVTEAALGTAIAESLAVAQVLAKLGLVPAGGNYKTVPEKIKIYGIDTCHFMSAAWNLGGRYRAFGKCAPLAEILIENSSYHSTYGLKKRLLKAQLKEHCCEEYLLPEWQGLPIPLELHHRNGVNNDHRLENLQLLCSKCHAQITSYRGKNKLKGSARVV